MGEPIEDGGKRHVAHIDGLRAVAVLSVIVYHLHASWLPGGFAGVDVFFVISGFVVSGSLDGARGQALGGYLLNFYARRLRRIAPALIVMLGITGALSAAFITDSWLSETNTQTGHAAFFGMSNLELIATNGDYFSVRTELNPFTHTWSLGVEEQFYVAFPLLFFAWTVTSRWRWLSLALIAGGGAASLAFAITASTRDPAVAFYALPSRFWQLAAGALLFQILSMRGADARSRGGRWRGPAVVASAAGLAAAMWLARPGHSSYPDGILPVIATLGLLLSLHESTGGGLVRRVLESRVAVGVGLLSYSLYLWHWPVFVLFRWTIGLERSGTQVMAVVLTFVAATGSYLLVERPFRYSPIVARAPRLAIVGVAVVAIVVAAQVFQVVDEHRHRVSLSTVAAHQQDWFPYVVPRTVDCPARADLTEARAVFTSVYASCSTTPARGRIFAVGDSHLLMYALLLDRVALETDRDVFMSYREGCPFASLAPGTATVSPGCEAYESTFLREVEARAEPGDVLFLSSLRLGRLGGQTGWATDSQVQAFVAAAADVDRTDEIAATVALLEPLARRGLRIVFAAPTPVFQSPSFRCADWFNRGNPVCDGGFTIDRALLEEYRRPVLSAYEAIADALPGVTVWDPLPVLCPDTVCHATVGGRPLFFDGDHLSGFSNTLLAPSFVTFLDG